VKILKGLDQLHSWIQTLQMSASTAAQAALASEATHGSSPQEIPMNEGYGSRCGVVSWYTVDKRAVSGFGTSARVIVKSPEALLAIRLRTPCR